MSALQFLVPWKKKSIPQKILVVQHMVKGLPPLFRSTSNKTKAFEVRLFFFLVKLIVNWVDFYNLFFCGSIIFRMVNVTKMTSLSKNNAGSFLKTSST